MQGLIRPSFAFQWAVKIGAIAWRSKSTSWSSSLGFHVLDELSAEHQNFTSRQKILTRLECAACSSKPLPTFNFLLSDNRLRQHQGNLFPVLYRYTKYAWARQLRLNGLRVPHLYWSHRHRSCIDSKNCETENQLWCPLVLALLKSSVKFSALFIHHIRSSSETLLFTLLGWYSKDFASKLFTFAINLLNAIPLHHRKGSWTFPYLPSGSDIL